METAPCRPGESPQKRWMLLSCLAIALLLRCIVIWLNVNELTHDRDAYLPLASGIAAGRGYVVPESQNPTAYRPPLYPVLLAGLMVALPPAASVAVVNLVWSLVAVWATWRAADWLSLGWGRLVAALLVATDPMLILYSAQPMTEVTCAGLVALLVLLLVRRDGCDRTHQFCIGILFGALVLCRPTFWPLAGLALVGWGCSRFSRRSDGEQPVTPSFPWRVIVGTLVVVAPWVIRNQVVMGSPILMTTHGGYTLLLANNPVFYTDVVDQGWGTEWKKDSFDRWQGEVEADLSQQLGDHATEVDRDRWQGLWARQFIASQPGRFLKAVVYRVRSLWSTTPQGDSAAAAGSSLIQFVGWFYTIELLALAIGLVAVGFRITRGACPAAPWCPLLALVLTVQLVHLVYWTNARMRAPIVPVICLFANGLFCAPKGAPVTARNPMESSTSS